MNAQELIYLLESVQFETRKEWEDFYRETHEIFDNLPKEEQEMIIEDNSFEMLSMIIEAYKYGEVQQE